MYIPTSNLFVLSELFSPEKCFYNMQLPMQDFSTHRPIQVPSYPKHHASIIVNHDSHHPEPLTS
jgi:hypothetical protein